MRTLLLILNYIKMDDYIKGVDATFSTLYNRPSGTRKIHGIEYDIYERKTKEGLEIMKHHTRYSHNEGKDSNGMYIILLYKNTND